MTPTLSPVVLLYFRRLRRWLTGELVALEGLAVGAASWQARPDLQGLGLGGAACRRGQAGDPTAARHRLQQVLTAHEPDLQTTWTHTHAHKSIRHTPNNSRSSQEADPRETMPLLLHCYATFYIYNTLSKWWLWVPLAQNNFQKRIQINKYIR